MLYNHIHWKMIHLMITVIGTYDRIGIGIYSDAMKRVTSHFQKLAIPPSFDTLSSKNTNNLKRIQQQLLIVGSCMLAKMASPLMIGTHSLS